MESSKGREHTLPLRLVQTGHEVAAAIVAAWAVLRGSRMLRFVGDLEGALSKRLGSRQWES